ncbi:hypothetical protein [Amycolatopsis sp. cmx-11-51]|uniref:hypothetical protein n=1 Tax=Amycolatopsis sp. cmx-11-51 TaxID=2785797 RepID=UPI0039E2CA0D
MAAGDLITRDGQLEWRGILLGAGTAYGWRALEGWLDLPQMRGGDVDRPGQHGAFPGQLLAQSRTISYSFVISARRATREQYTAAVDLLRGVTTPAENPDEEPLVIRLHGQRWMVTARCTRRQVPTGLSFDVGYVAGALQWVATDPRLLELPAYTASTPLGAVGTGGLGFPVAFPMPFGAAVRGGVITWTNAGSAEAWPLWRITGPVRGPSITRRDTGQALEFDPDWTIPAGQSVEVDTLARTVLFADSGVSASDRLFTRGWFSFPPGVSTQAVFASTATSSDALLSVAVHNTAM